MGRYTTKDMTGIKEEVQQQTNVLQVGAGIEDFSVMAKKETQKNERVIFILCNSLLVQLCKVQKQASNSSLQS